ncbi:hypothetical protein DY000_02022713 [Brassica cretica]|uniref:Uncharacterized protein n=1 Tax=Brassica cretica TaxID=69181 RepID=A0ABQ7E6R3_BRACR|nr:hypothetical protein DY000_02022713 [Brassica cretica]
MHPPNLKLMDTTNGVRSCGESSFGKGKEISNSISEDNDRMGRTVDCSKIKGVDGLKESIYAEYCLLGREISAEISYWLNDGESDMVGVGAAPVQITTDTDYKIFRALHRADKSVNVFVTFREFVGGEMIFLRSERVIMSQINASDGAPDNDEALLQHLEATEA